MSRRKHFKEQGYYVLKDVNINVNINASIFCFSVNVMVKHNKGLNQQRSRLWLKDRNTRKNHTFFHRVNQDILIKNLAPKWESYPQNVNINVLIESLLPESGMTFTIGLKGDMYWLGFILQN